MMPPASFWKAQMITSMQITSMWVIFNVCSFACVMLCYTDAESQPVHLNRTIISHAASQRPVSEPWVWVLVAIFGRGAWVLVCQWILESCTHHLVVMLSNWNWSADFLGWLCHMAGCGIGPPGLYFSKLTAACVYKRVTNREQVLLGKNLI